jgi:hypothetical protein
MLAVRYGLDCFFFKKKEKVRESGFIGKKTLKP